MVEVAPSTIIGKYLDDYRKRCQKKLKTRLAKMPSKAKVSGRRVNVELTVVKSIQWSSQPSFVSRSRLHTLAIINTVAVPVKVQRAVVMMGPLSSSGPSR